MTYEEQRNVAILKEAFERWHETKGGSVDHWLSIMAEEVELRSLADGAPEVTFTQRRHSRDEVVGYLTGLTEQFQMIHYTVEEYVAQGDQVVALGRTAWRNRQSGESFDTPKVDVARFKDGKMVSFHEFYDTAMVRATSESPIKNLVRACYDARRREDVDEVLTYFHADATFRIVIEPAVGALGHQLRGHDQLRTAFEELFATWDWAQFPITELIAEGEKVVVRSGGTLLHTPSGADVEYEILDLLTIRNGKIADFVEFLDTAKLQQIIEAAGE